MAIQDVLPPLIVDRDGVDGVSRDRVHRFGTSERFLHWWIVVMFDAEASHRISGPHRGRTRHRLGLRQYNGYSPVGEGSLLLRPYRHCLCGEYRQASWSPRPRSMGKVQHRPEDSGLVVGRLVSSGSRDRNQLLVCGGRRRWTSRGRVASTSSGWAGSA